MKKGQILAIAAAIGVTVLIYLAARTPNESEVNQTEASAETESVETLNTSDPLDAKVAEAVRIIQTGDGPPMQAVGLLREVVQADSNHIGANYWLGEFSMMSGQFEKAIERFNKLTRLQPDNVEYCIKLAQSYDGAGQTDLGVDVLNAYLASHSDDETKEQIEPVLNKLSVKL